MLGIYSKVFFQTRKIMILVETKFIWVNLFVVNLVVTSEVPTNYGALVCKNVQNSEAITNSYSIWNLFLGWLLTDRGF